MSRSMEHRNLTADCLRVRMPYLILRFPIGSSLSSVPWFKLTLSASRYVNHGSLGGAWSMLWPRGLTLPVDNVKTMPIMELVPPGK